MDDHQLYIRRCFMLASHGMYTTRPNPMVGSVIVHNGKIIGEGWHKMPGEPHAEVVAIQSVKDQHLLSESTLFVNLEPCSHYGRTPPCSLLIFEKKIPKVVIANTDPNPLVSGRGIQTLRAHGVMVTAGVLAEEGWDLNRHFFTFHTLKRPFIHLKWAESVDGYIAPQGYSTGKPYIISSRRSLQLAHHLRASLQAILIGSSTAYTDDPYLSTRLIDGPSPQKFVIDRRRKLPESLKIFQSGTSATRIVDIRNARQGDIGIKMNQDWSWLHQLMDELYKREIQSLQVEGGAMVIEGFIQQGLWDEAWLIKSATQLKKGIKGPIKEPLWPHLKHLRESDSDTLFIFQNSTKFPKRDTTT